MKYGIYHQIKKEYIRMGMSCEEVVHFLWNSVGIKWLSDSHVKRYMKEKVACNTTDKRRPNLNDDVRLAGKTDVRVLEWKEKIDLNGNLEKIPIFLQREYVVCDEDLKIINPGIVYDWINKADLKEITKMKILITVSGLNKSSAPRPKYYKQKWGHSTWKKKKTKKQYQKHMV
jgi:hypothetical protein